MAAAADGGATEAAGFVQARGPAPWRLARRDPRLGGNVPVRAARACPPFLLGNGLGWQLAPPGPITVARGWRKLSVDPTPLRAAWLGPDRIEITFDTGLRVRPARGVVLVLERAHNRRDRRVDVVEAELAGPSDLHVTLRLRLRRGDGEAVLEGELAGLAAFAPAPLPRVVTLAGAPEIGRAHLEFFDRAYFEAKRRAPTERYKKRALAAGRPARASAAAATLVHAGGAAPTLARSATGLVSVTVPCEIDARLCYHGLRVEAALDERALARRAAGIERTWNEALGELAGPDTGAIRYFTGYATPHAPGDPHLFFKPATLLRVPAGWCAVLDGPAGDGFEILRGVTAASWFHALPAVVELQRERVSLRAGDPLLRVRPVPERFLDLPLEWE